MSHRSEMIGIKFGRLTPIDIVNEKSIHLKYICECDCGNIIEVAGNSLRNGNTKSCGCIRRPNLIGYENDHGIVISKIKNQFWEIDCKHCGETHIQNQREIRNNARSLSCESYKPPNWSGLEKKDRDLRHSYGISLEDFNGLIEFQNNLCGICFKPIEHNRKSLNVDHDHETNEVRGILCSSCNTGLGRFGDSVEGLKRAIYYLENPPYSEYKQDK